jgi:hypothetical protein
MKVSIKNFSVDMEIKNTGIELDVYSPDGGTHLGDLVINKKYLTWCKGRTKPENGVNVKWADFIAWMEQPPKKP